MSNVITHLLSADGAIPNHPRFPLLVYPHAFPESVTAETIIDRFESNRWKDHWINGVFPYHHFHTTAHEVLGCFRGRAIVQFGGRRGPELEIAAGAAVVIPAGVGHKRLSASTDFGVVGAYPPGENHDLCTGTEPDAAEQAARIAAVPLPPADPIHGEDGPLFEHWKVESVSPS